MIRYLIFLSLSVILFGCSTKSTIVNSVPEREANEIVVLLNSKGILAEKVPAPVSTVGGGSTEVFWNINVPPEKITEALSVLNQAGLPRLKGTSLLDLFGSQGLVPSDTQDKIRYQEGLSEQLATTIRKMDGIIDANVQITFPTEDLPAKKITASVYVKHRGILDNPNSLAITKIKRLISSAVPGLTIENVAVITDRALYADVNLQTPQQLQEDKQFASVWSVVIAKDSIPLFRLIFYTFIILIFSLICFAAWLIWKFLPLIQQKGGFSSLFHPEQFKKETVVVEETPTDEENER